MDELDLVSLQCLRRASRKFLRIFLDASFRRWRLDLNVADIAMIGNHSSYLPSIPYSLAWRPFLPWPRAALYVSGSPVSRTLRARPALDVTETLCSDCQTHETKRNWKWRYILTGPFATPYTGSKFYVCCLCRLDADDCKCCRECREHHDLACFSYDQCSLVVPRRCIGHKGYLRLCAHKVVRWHDVSGFAKRFAKQDSEGRTALRRKVIVEYQHSRPQPLGGSIEHERHVSHGRRPEQKQ